MFPAVSFIEAALPRAAAVKANLAFFEAFGSEGLEALERLRGRIPPEVPFIADAKRARSELGYLQPVIRRAFMMREGLRSDATVRLGEDFLLYATARARGARFRIVDSAGYVAVARPDSLSHSHTAQDLAA